MALNPFQRHTQFVQAKEAARQGGTGRHATGYDQQLLQLSEDKRRLKGIQSTLKRAGIKVEVLPKYAPWVAGVLAADGKQQDDVLMYLMVWRTDAGDYAGALDIARHALKHGWVMPRGFDRNPQTVIAEEFADAAMAAASAKQPFDAGILLEALDVLGERDMPDQSRARLHKAIAYAQRQGNPAAALNHLRHALQRDKNSGVKKDIEQLERQLRNASNG
ncbi:phage terminase small subunit [Erwiniaceae bacterium BAC15a-03b]|uniref:Phage terminase small subunit n=1 Tax=Winslowiella arboricola TaxID=2978220 RepID=A0A9J6PQD0_9GAMM|nr:phage terminase small subunit [Winslowiella arboricola]MCU5773081.1 phage terminase small subunit [Winslowiella arboricola]MCU5777824.1 phage terminase small subunit [Winslowiella arboricola]